MATTAQIFTILGILCAPMITIGALVLTLAALNMSLGVRRLYVKILGLIFDYATKIKQNKEMSIDPDTSSDEPSTPVPSPKTAKVALPIVEKPPDGPVEITSKTPLVSESKQDVNNENDAEQSQETTNDDQKLSRDSSQTTDIQFKLGKIIG
jgi:hypothetical protein